VSNVLQEDKKQQILALGRLGWSLRRIQKSVGVRRETAGDYLRAAGIAVRPPGGWGRAAPAKPANEVTTDSELSCSKPANEVTADSGAELARQPGGSPSTSACELYREAIELGLSRGRNAMAIFQDLVDGHAFAGSYETVKRFVRRLRGTQSPQASVVIETAPGEETQVDYGTGPMVRDPATGKYRRTRLFVLTFGYSRKAIRLLVFRSGPQTWAELHEKEYAISTLLHGNFTWTFVLRELRKCEIRCANCHRRKTAREKGSYRLNLKAGGQSNVSKTAESP
jgi:hypothetical protein